MYIVELGLLYHESPLLQVSFYRKDEELTDETIQKIILGIYSIVPEIFKDQVLKRLNVAKYTIMFQGCDITDSTAGQDATGPVDPGNLVLAYAIVDLESEKLDRTSIKTIQAKLNQMSLDFKASVQDKMLDIDSVDLQAFDAHVKDIFSDMLLNSTDRFDRLWNP